MAGQMRYKQIILGFLILAYALSLVHNIVPHRHFNVHQQSASHHPANSKHNHSDNGDQQQEGGLFFPAHFSNADVSISKLSSGQNLKVKTERHFVKTEDVLITGLCFLPPVFHVPRDSSRYNQLIFVSRCLRAPPSIS